MQNNHLALGARSIHNEPDPFLTLRPAVVAGRAAGQKLITCCLNPHRGQRVHSLLSTMSSEDGFFKMYFSSPGDWAYRISVAMLGLAAA